MFGQDRRTLRQMYRTAWQKATRQQALTALEAQIVAVIHDHPEYQREIESGMDQEYLPESGQTNPFLHMSLHLAVRDQLATNRPHGIAQLYKQLQERCGDAHDAEHRLTEFMGQELWQAQRDRRAPDEQRYLKLVKDDLDRR
ncbi:MAG: DUF1841 family protein [Gammaproteobacteria bacterium]|nr:DUF1841 family protein [Gammaproteobacteria bacterium]